jgi:hypothetical protein
MIEHSDRKHALLSASGAARWINCTPSARLEEKCNASSTSSTSSDYADEGTLAHEIASLFLFRYRGDINKNIFETELKGLKANRLYKKEMLIEVDKYTSYVIDAYTEAKKRTKGSKLIIEEKLDFSGLVENGFGTGDAIIISDGELEIIDLKYGMGIKVDAENNSQLKMYAAGALFAFELAFDITSIKMTIVQPRLDSILSAIISPKALIDWGNKIVRPAAILATNGEGLQHSGDWCRWCKVKPMCATIAADNIRLARNDFKDPHLLSDNQIEEVFKQIPILQDWAASVADYMLSKAKEGKIWKGYKLVEGRSIRKWIDEEKVISWLRLNHKEHEFMISKLAGIPAIEKLTKDKEYLNSLIYKPTGAPTLVPESDKRQKIEGKIDQIKSDFSE